MSGVSTGTQLRQGRHSVDLLSLLASSPPRLLASSPPHLLASCVVGAAGGAAGGAPLASAVALAQARSPASQAASWGGKLPRRSLLQPSQLGEG